MRHDVSARGHNPLAIESVSRREQKATSEMKSNELLSAEKHKWNSLTKLKWNCIDRRKSMNEFKKAISLFLYAALFVATHFSRRNRK